ncbi:MULTISPECIES: LysR family transcriptional regulator [Mycobacteriaceae]|uniref:Probable hydrogen peroxide-inducible genes activator n=1 Tax=Mycolicibacterium mucogenicum TaxID=56689 RepID=A0A4R5WI36_MYCMU|nr:MULTISPECIES: LysR family transcriptional regulator [Mycolicibacterium]MCX8556242.1 LysR family transcriptional regulator [Mycolicibacterium mucogenicum]TDK90106.1 LysR family transcriptional regulator [Mycolicibacterium mucogenicum]BCI83875.1 LysR family transcriptional regulator [Mycolicibacterium sp. TY66]BCJ84505.1 LysR family transcriptional regulator [Mycolicibacterium sp. TY81]GCA99876.1 LysR family transcriptional regulator [Mycolicibacterium sp. NCC-Tsukiji]
MELRQVEHFVAVAIERSFTRAARRVHVVQSAVSTSVAKLERELGVQLFDRSRQQIELTVAGERFLAQAHELLRVAGSAAESVASSRGRLMGSVEFGSLISYGPMNVAQVLGEFHRAHPLVRLRLQLNQSGASAYLSALVDGALDLALVSVPNRLPPQLEMRLMFEEPMLFVCRDDHPMAAEKVVGLLDLAAEDLIGFPPDWGFRSLLDNAFLSAGVQSRPVHVIPAGFSVIGELVRQGLGTTFMPASECAEFEDLRAIELRQTVTWQVYLASQPRDRLTPATAALADMLIQAAPS